MVATTPLDGTKSCLPYTGGRSYGHERRSSGITGNCARIPESDREDDCDTPLSLQLSA